MKNIVNVFNLVGIVGVVDLSHKRSARNLVRLQAHQEKAFPDGYIGEAHSILRHVSVPVKFHANEYCQRTKADLRAKEIYP